MVFGAHPQASFPLSQLTSKLYSDTPVILCLRIDCCPCSPHLAAVNLSAEKRNQQIISYCVVLAVPADRCAVLQLVRRKSDGVQSHFACCLFLLFVKYVCVFTELCSCGGGMVG